MGKKLGKARVGRKRLASRLGQEGVREIKDLVDILGGAYPYLISQDRHLIWMRNGNPNGNDFERCATYTLDLHDEDELYAVVPVAMTNDG